jgi:hypothetical protein
MNEKRKIKREPPRQHSCKTEAPPRPTNYAFAWLREKPKREARAARRRPPRDPLDLLREMPCDLSGGGLERLQYSLSGGRQKEVTAKAQTYCNLDRYPARVKAVDDIVAAYNYLLQIEGCRLCYEVFQRLADSSVKHALSPADRK